MQTFTIGLGHRLWTQVFTCSPLVRGSDRFEVLVRGLAVLLAVVSIPVAEAIGTSVHDARTRVRAEETLTRHEVMATAVADGVMVAHPGMRCPLLVPSGVFPAMSTRASLHGRGERKSVTSKPFG